VGIAFSGLRKSFVTRNTNSSMDDGGKQVSMRLVKGPFSRLEGHWRFHPVGDGTQRLQGRAAAGLRLRNGAVAAIIGPVFDRIAGSMVDAFIKRAEQIYG
jgi:ribosome-associated toxin RatA of RatAB toxin-antitoxin module